MTGCKQLQRGFLRLSKTPAARTGAALFMGLCLLALTPDQAAANAGRTTAVVQQAEGTPPGQPTRTLRPQLDVFANERIRTDEVGVTQILFVDGTSLTVGPRSDLVIDRFVYDPAASTGELVGRLGGGVLRVVGGRISKSGRIEITTPVAVIGVRGGIAVVRHDPEEGTRAVFLFGEEMTVTGLGPDARQTETKTVTRAGFATSVSAEGGVADAAPVQAEELSAVLGALEGEEDETAPEASREAVASASSGYTEEAGGLSTGLVTAAAAQGAETVPDAAEEAVEEVVEGVVEEAEAPPSPPGLWVFNAAGSNISYSLPALAFDRSRSHPFTIVKQEGNTVNPSGYRGLSVRSRFVGRSADQEAAVFVITSYVGPSDDYPGVRLLTRTAGSVRDPSRDHDGRAATFVTHVDGEEDRGRHPSPAFNGETPPEGFTLVGQQRSDGRRQISVLPQNHWYDGDGDGNDDDGVFVSSPYVSDPVVEYRLDGPVRPVTHFGPRSDGVWKGYATGLFQGWNTNDDNFIYVLSSGAGSPDDVSIYRSTQYSILGASFALGLDEGGSDGVTSMLLEFGRFAGQQDKIRSVHPRGDILRVSTTRGTYLSDDIFAAQSSLAYWGDNARAQRLIWVNDQLIREAGPGRSPTRTWLFSNAAAPADGLLPDGVRFCDCPAAKFGWWGGRISFDDPDDSSIERRDDVFPGAFTVGPLPEMAAIPTVGTASYSGHAGATVHDGSATYAAVGGFSMDWNFGTRTGTAEISNLDGRNYEAAGLTAPLANPRDFGGALNQAGGPGSASGTMAGSFFSDGSNPVVDAGGKFTMTGGGYMATGAFAATSQ